MGPLGSPEVDLCSRLRGIAVAAVKRLPHKKGRIKQANNTHAAIRQGLDELNNPGVDLEITVDEVPLVEDGTMSWNNYPEATP